jgi:hypothetical protein
MQYPKTPMIILHNSNRNKVDQMNVLQLDWIFKNLFLCEATIKYQLTPILRYYKTPKSSKGFALP